MSSPLRIAQLKKHLFVNCEFVNFDVIGQIKTVICNHATATIRQSVCLEFPKCDCVTA